MINPLRTDSLSQRELYLFDTTGVLKIPNFLSTKDIQLLQDSVFSCPSRVMEGRGDKIRYDNLTKHSSIIGTFAQSNSIMGCVEPLINQPFRLIESYGLYRQENSVFYLHNGMSEYIKYGINRRVQRNMSFTHTYHDGKLYCMFIKCLVYLTDIKTDEDGAFCYIQGSHKANYSWFPNGIEDSDKPALTLQNFPTLNSIHVHAGDILLLNEALLHGTLPKTIKRDRLVVAFSYAPCFVADWVATDITSNDIHKIGHF